MSYYHTVTTLITLLASSLFCQAQSHCSVRTFSVRDGLAANTISGIGQSPNGLMWIATWNGLCSYDGYQFTTFRSDNWTDADALSSNRISMIKPDSQENVWIRTYDGGLYLLDTRQCRFINVGLLLEHKYGKTIHPRNFYSLPTGHTWISDERGEMNLRIDDRFPIDIERIEVIDLWKYPQAGRYIRKVEVDKKGREWLTTDLGMVPYGQWSAIRPPATETDPSLPDTALTWRLEACGIKRSDIDKHYIDQQGNLWFTSTHGLTLVSFPDNRIQWIPFVEEQETRSLLCRHDGSVWAGAKDGHIGVYTTNGQRGWLNAQGQVVPTRTRFADHIYTMKEDSHGNTWIGTKGEGLFVISPQGTVRHYMPDATDRYSLSHQYVYDIDEDEQGNIWIGTYGGGLNLVRQQDDGTLRFLHSGNELKDYPIETFNRIRRITHNSQGVILLSCTEGLLTFSNHTRKYYRTLHHQQDSTSLRTSDVMQTLVTRKGHVYVITSGGSIQQVMSKGLLKDNLRLQLVKGLNRQTGNSLSMTEDQSGNIWIIHETEVCRFTPSTGQTDRFGPNSMAEHTELTEGQPAIDPDGHFWIAATGGLFKLNTKTLRKSNFRPNIIFTNLLYQGEQETYPILNRQTLTIPKDKRNLTISFAALDYGDNYLMEYAYRMDGDEEWNYINGIPRISFSQLPPGHHILEVKSTNGDGVWMDNIATLYLDVTPTFWERTWVRLLLLLLIIALATKVVLTYLKYRQQTREREQRMENILRQYRELQQTIDEQQQPTATPPHYYTLEEPKIVDADEEMMQQLMKFIEERISDEELKIEEMAEAVGLSRSIFYSKVKSVVGMSPIDFLRRLRMQRAQQLITHSTMNVSQIAYSVGFSDPKYFTRCFKKETGMTPREYREKGM